MGVVPYMIHEDSVVEMSVYIRLQHGVMEQASVVVLHSISPRSKGGN